MVYSCKLRQQYLANPDGGFWRTLVTAYYGTSCRFRQSPVAYFNELWLQILATSMVDFGKFRWQLPTFYSCIERIARERVHARRISSSLENYLLFFFFIYFFKKKTKPNQTILHKVKKVSPSKKIVKKVFLLNQKCFQFKHDFRSHQAPKKKEKRFLKEKYFMSK